MTEEIITAIQARPILWDKRNKILYRNRQLADREWAELANIIGTTSDIARKKWKNLRDTYIRELRKMSTVPPGHEPEYTGTWPYFDKMEFLKVTVKPRRNINDILNDYALDDTIEMSECSAHEGPEDLIDTDEIDNESGSTKVIDEKILPNTVDNNTQEEHSSSVPSSTIKNKRKRKEDLEALFDIQEERIKIHRQGETRKRKEDLEALLDIQQERIKIHRQDEYDHNDDDILWFRSMVPYMKQLPSLQKLHFRTRMQELLLKELSDLNSTQSDSLK